MKKYLIAAAALMAGTAALAQIAPVAKAPATPPPPMAHPMADHVMTRAEVTAMVRDHFTQLDTNNDGVITAAEAQEGREQWAEHKQAMGAAPGAMRHDGAMGDPNAAFDRFDTNKDGSISHDEFTKAHEQHMEKRMAAREEGSKNAKSPEMRMHQGGGMGARMIAMADTNKDGKTTLAEAEALALQHFDKMDTNHDGQVTPEERRAARPAMMKQMQAPSAG
jgi:Ca2+-binding EF-hand superfamily protein